MLRLLAGRLRFVVCNAGLGLLVLHTSAAGQIDGKESAAPGRQDARIESADTEAASVESLPIVLIGRVLGPDGAPRAGAVVVSSAGGQAVTDANGDYRLEAEVPLDATSVQVTAVAAGAGGSLVASGQVALTGSSVTPSGTLMLEQGGCCQPGWVRTFGEQPGVAGGTGGEVFALTVFDDGSGPALYVGGYFTSAGGVLANSLAK